ncbi:hypothetical protein Efla_003766 [Eimeria flavescens]
MHGRSSSSSNCSSSSGTGAEGGIAAKAQPGAAPLTSGYLQLSELRGCMVSPGAGAPAAGVVLLHAEQRAFKLRAPLRDAPHKASAGPPCDADTASRQQQQQQQQLLLLLLLLLLRQGRRRGADRKRGPTCSSASPAGKKASWWDHDPRLGRPQARCRLHANLLRGGAASDLDERTQTAETARAAPHLIRSSNAADGSFLFLLLFPFLDREKEEESAGESAVGIWQHHKEIAIPLACEVTRHILLQFADRTTGEAADACRWICQIVKELSGRKLLGETGDTRFPLPDPLEEDQQTTRARASGAETLHFATGASTA